MTVFGLDYERSLALHSAVAEKLRKDPEIVNRARRKLDEWLASEGGSTPLWRRWWEILNRSPDAIALFLVERSEEAAWLRKASPFAGLLRPEERLSILRKTRARFESAA